MDSNQFEIGELIVRELIFDTVFWVAFLVSIIIISIVRANNLGHIVSLFNSSINFNQINSSTKLKPTYLLLFNYLTITSCFVLILLNHASQNLKYNWDLFSIFLALLITHLIKSLICYFLASNFKRKLFFDLIHQIRAYQIIGLLLIPFILLSYFQSLTIQYWVLIAGTVVGIITYNIYLLKSFRLAIQNNIPFLYIILYLCTLEIMPVLLVSSYLLD